MEDEVSSNMLGPEKGLLEFGRDGWASEANEEVKGEYVDADENDGVVVVGEEMDEERELLVDELVDMLERGMDRTLRWVGCSLLNGTDLLLFVPGRSCQL